jgi:hypothetical protein
MHLGLHHRSRLLAALLAGLFLCAGCRVDRPDIDTWKGTVKGPGKMVAVLLADKYELELRAYAALALVAMDRHDVDGSAQLLSALQRLDASTRDQIMASVSTGLIELMKKDGSGPAGQPPPPHQVRAKDAAFSLLPLCGADSRKKLGDAVVGWYVQDFDDRSLSGNYSAEQVVRALGSPAAKALVDALSAKLPQPALVKLAELIGQLGDAETRKRAADTLVGLEAEMRDEPFLRWLESEITRQLGDDAKPDPTRVQKAALLNRERFIDEGAIPAMKHLADQPAVAQRLLAIAATKDPLLTERRTRALQALEGKVDESHLDALLSLALDSTSPASVQDYAFDRVADIRSAKAIPPMWPLVQDDKNQRLRWRAGELVLTLGGVAVLGEFFAKLPSGKGVQYEPEELDGYAQRMGQMTPLPTAVASGQLGSPDWWDRVIALRYFERKGTEQDAVALSKLLDDAATPTGKTWPAGSTVGTVAKQAVDGLRQRLGHGALPGSG